MATVVQWIECLPPKQKVTGSIPVGRAIHTLKDFEMTKQNRKKIQQRQKGYVVGFVYKDVLRFIDEPVIYDTKKEALNSVKILSPQFPNVPFVILELQHYLMNIKEVK